MPYWVKKTSTLLRLYYIMGQRSKWKPFFSDFSRKNHCSHVHILSKKCPISKKTRSSHALILSKTSILSKTQCSHAIFFQLFHETPPVPIIGQITPILSKLLYIMGQKSQYDALHDFSRKNHYSLAHILLKNCPFSKKHVAVIPIFSQKTVHSLKTRCSHVLFFNFFMENPLLSCT